jgi:hypothetical protein
VRGGRVEAQFRRINGEVLAVVDESPALDVADIVDDEAGSPDLVSGVPSSWIRCPSFVTTSRVAWETRPKVFAVIK